MTSCYTKFTVHPFSPLPMYWSDSYTTYKLQIASNYMKNKIMTDYTFSDDKTK